MAKTVCSRLRELSPGVTQPTGQTSVCTLTNRDGDVCGLLLLGVDERTHLERAVVAAAAVARVVVVAVVVCGRRDAALWREIQILLLLAPLGVSLLLLLLGPNSKENLFVGLAFWFEK